jgi:hypothetical protein
MLSHIEIYCDLFDLVFYKSIIYKYMKKITYIIAILSLILSFNTTEARTVRVKSYYKPSIGKYVSSYHKTSSNKTKLDNWSTKGNYNPYTGKKGTMNPYKY